MSKYFIESNKVTNHLRDNLYILAAKDGGQCPPNVLKLDDSKLCEWTNFQGVCKVDDDCPGNKLCCFDFCKGGQCRDPIPLEPGRTIHGGRGYRAN